MGEARANFSRAAAGSGARRVLLGCVLVYAAASLAHFAHNGVFLHDYPNMPAWLTSAGVYGAWLAVTALGSAGYLLYRGGARRAGLSLLAVYAALGFGALAHWWRAPLSAHSVLMNLTILAEAVSGAALLAWLALMWRASASPTARS
jgi:hypothetical protein